MGQEKEAQRAARYPDPGSIPQLRMIDKRMLTIEPMYQRQVSSVRGQNLIAKLAAGWHWAHAAVIIVAERGERFVIIDGQHRHQASLRRADIRDLPCLVVDAATIKQQAAAFIAHNRDRITLGSLAIFHASHQAGDPIIAAVVRACATAGVVIRRGGGTVAKMKPDETMATGAMTDALRLWGEDHLATTLKLLREAFRSKRGQLRGHLIRAAAGAIKLGVDQKTLVDQLKQTDTQKLEDAARLLRHEGLSIPQAYLRLLADKCGLSITVSEMAALTRAPKSKPKKKAKVVRIAPAAKPKPEPKPKPVKAPPAPPPPALKGPAMRKPAATPFVLKRKTAPSEPKPIKPPEFRGDVPVRRFEGGTMEMLIEAAVASQGLELVRGKDRGKNIWKIGHRKFTQTELIKFVDEIRAKQNLPPILAA